MQRASVCPRKRVFDRRIVGNLGYWFMGLWNSDPTGVRWPRARRLAVGHIYSDRHRDLGRVLLDFGNRTRPMHPFRPLGRKQIQLKETIVNTAPDLKADWQAAQAAADKAYATHLSADRQAAISWGGNGQLKDAAYTASDAWKEGDRVADLAYAAYASTKNTERSAATA